MRLWSNILFLQRLENEVEGSTQSRIDPFALFVCQTADNCKWQHNLTLPFKLQ